MKRLFASVLLMATASQTLAQPAPLAATRFNDFSTYTLALSWQNGFCQSVSERGGRIPDECRQSEDGPLLTAHGLWPSLPASVAARGVDNRRWMRFGCATRPIPNYPEARGRKCALPAPGLSNGTRERLAAAMPGAGGQSCLERYEYAKHGACFGFDANAYFLTLSRLGQEVSQSPLGIWLQAHNGKTVSRRDFNDAVAKSFGESSVKAVKLTCHGNPAYLTEMQWVIDANQINSPLSAESLVPQPRPGNCPAQFILDARGL